MKLKRCKNTTRRNKKTGRCDSNKTTNQPKTKSRKMQSAQEMPLSEMKFLMTHWIRTLEAELRDIKATKKSFTKEQKKESERYIETRWVVLEESSLNEQYKYMARVIWGGLHKDKPELRMCDLADVIQHLKSDL